MTTEEQQLVERLKPSYVVDAGLNIIMIVLRDHGAAAEAQVLNEWIVANNALKAKAADTITRLVEERDEARELAQLFSQVSRKPDWIARAAASEAKVAELQEALKPFAKAADVKLCGEWRDDERFGHTDITFHLTFGDLRAARRALEQSK